jgi:hypothetical protein
LIAECYRATALEIRALTEKLNSICMLRSSEKDSFQQARMPNIQIQKTGALNPGFFQQHLPASDLERYAYEKSEAGSVPWSGVNPEACDLI